MLWNIDIPSFLEMCEDVVDLPLANIGVHSNFLRCHLDAEPDYDPLDGSRYCFSWRHIDGKLQVIVSLKCLILAAG